ncbi:hypothetical protein QS460_04375 [Liquorilactobacillus mali]|uniref:hypothetical protein n=1 Tax=Liquorilactobacillus mali TaxID=1618 RepID=UPI002652FBB5|nr:hypothetical protein [Liquorilactobacillus mali]MDN7145161.1 hypothetical protein [Liquorilactobacillus mali]
MAIFILVISLGLIFFILRDFRIMKKEQESIDDTVEINQKLADLNVNLKKLNEKNFRLPKLEK